MSIYVVIDLQTRRHSCRTESGRNKNGASQKENIMSMIGERVENCDRWNEKFKGKKGTVVGGDEYTIIVEWDGIDGQHEHDPYAIRYTHEGRS
jgi:hypothetical protein